MNSRLFAWLRALLVLVCGVRSTRRTRAATLPLPGDETTLVEPGDARVAGGRPVQGNKYPWVAQIKLPGNKMCGGALVSCQTVVTAAHCVEPFSTSQLTGEARVVLGNAKKDVGKSFGVVDVAVHGRYSSAGFDSSSDEPVHNDIAVIKLSEPTNIRPVRLSGGDPRVGSRGSVLGWGQTESDSTSDVLRQAVLQVHGREQCESSSRKQYFDFDSSICTGSALQIGSADQRPRPEKGPRERQHNAQSKPSRSSRASACAGDSGGPFVDLPGRQLWGVVSYAYATDTSSSACGDQGRQTVMASIADARNFIQSSMRGDQCRPPGGGDPGGGGGGGGFDRPRPNYKPNKDKKKNRRGAT